MKDLELPPPMGESPTVVPGLPIAPVLQAAVKPAAELKVKYLPSKISLDNFSAVVNPTNLLGNYPRSKSLDNRQPAIYVSCRNRIQKFQQGLFHQTRSDIGQPDYNY